MDSNQKPRAVFMAFGTKGDVYPIAAIAAALSSDQPQYRVVLITHSAHQSLIPHLSGKNVSFFPIPTPPVLSAHQDQESTGASILPFSMQKKIITREHRQQCLDAMESLFGINPSKEGDFIVINFFALEGWNLAELFHVHCIVAAPYVVPYSAPSSFESQFKNELPLLYNYLQQAHSSMVGWKDVVHWMWPLFTEDWGSWRCDLVLSHCPLTDPVTGLPMLHDWAQSPLLLYGFSKEIVECPEISALVYASHLSAKNELCSIHADLKCFMEATAALPIFIGLSSIGSMGFLRNARAFLRVLEVVTLITNHKFVLLTSGYEPLDDAIRLVTADISSGTQNQYEDGVALFSGQVYCFPGTIPYNWLFQRCAVAIHHGGSGSVAAALHAGIPQVICPFMLDQFYWAERMFWLGVAPEPLHKSQLLPNKDDDASIRNSALALSNAINSALSLRIKARATEIAHAIASEDGVGEAVKILKQEVVCVGKTKN